MKKKEVFAFLSVIAGLYILSLLRIVLFKSGMTSELRHLQLIPLLLIHDFITEGTALPVIFKNLLGNIAIFVPLGVLLPCFFKKLTLKTTVLCGS